MAKTKQERCFLFWPRMGKTVEALFERGFFLKNPDAESDEAYVCYYWEPEQAKKYRESHPDAKVWTVVEAEGKEYVFEGWHYVNRLHYLIEA